MIYRNIEFSIYRNIERVLSAIHWHPCVFNADTAVLNSFHVYNRYQYQISKSYISTTSSFLLIEIVSNSIPISVSNTNWSTAIKYSQCVRSSRKLIGPHCWPLASGDGAQTGNAILCRACSASRAHHLYSLRVKLWLKSAHSNSSRWCTSSRDRRQQLIGTSWSLIHCIAFFPSPPLPRVSGRGPAGCGLAHDRCSLRGVGESVPTAACRGLCCTWYIKIQCINLHFGTSICYSSPWAYRASVCVPHRSWILIWDEIASFWIAS